MQMEKEMEIETETETETEMEMEMEMVEMEMDIEMEMEMDMEMEMEMWMEMEMDIFGAPKACSQLRFASKWLLTPDFEVLEASGARKVDQGSPKKPPKSSRGALKRLPRGSSEVLWELLEVQKAP